LSGSSSKNTSEALTRRASIQDHQKQGLEQSSDDMADAVWQSASLSLTREKAQGRAITAVALRGPQWLVSRVPSYSTHPTIHRKVDRRKAMPNGDKRF
jgi:hypothetical protein